MAFGALPVQSSPNARGNALILAHHIILTGYGHWLPNDPRGSLSREFRKPELRELGEIHFGRKKVQPSARQIREFYQAAAPYLQFPVLWFDRPARKAIAAAFGRVIRKEVLTCYACAVLRNHAHLLIRKHSLKAEGMIALLHEHSANALRDAGMAPPDHPVWSQDQFVAFKDNPKAIRGTVRYIEDNPRKHRLKHQAWDFVVPYDGWPFHKRG